MTRRPLPFFASLFAPEAPEHVSQPADITASTETVPESEPEVSEESEQILRRGNWDYMWRKARDKDAQSHPQFEADADPGFHPDLAHEDEPSQ